MGKVKWGVLGTAGILGCTAPGMKKAENCEMYAVAGRSEEKTKEFQKKYGFEKAYFSYEELLDDEAVQAVYIPLPNQLHYEWTVKALKKKKHVLCEKPLAPTKEQVEEMFAVAKENGVILMEAFAYQHSPIMETLTKTIKDGAIGEVRYIETAFLTSDYEMTNIRMQKDCYGGSLYDLGVYDTSCVLRLLDEEPEKVQAIAQFSDGGVDLLTETMLQFKSGARAAFTCGMVLSHETARRFDRLEIQGSKGSIHAIDFEYNKSGSISYELEIFGEEKKVVTVECEDNYMLEVKQLGECILHGEKPFVTEEFSIKNAALIDRILEKIEY